ncbi:MAG TPA: hydroxymethylglutaryl-CoA lyase [Acidimicrobiales bacterium]|nr:hydroxymethylglutaryl-CoA lyase [Acidimicrobiales bacterium]
MAQKTSAPPHDVTIREVGPRDGLQAEAPLPVEARVAIIEALVGAGVRQIEAVAFVSPRAVPSMAGAAEVLQALERVPGVTYWALVPNLKGAELALEAGVDGLSLTVSASETYSQKNVHMSVEESATEAGRIAELAAGRVPVDAVVSFAFGSPYEGDFEPATVAALGRRLAEGGATSLTYADTTGMATPRRVTDLLASTGHEVGLHLHETRGTALVSAYAALEAGVNRFDTSIGGLGGSPFAAGAAGNLATEDLVHLLDDLGVATGIDLEALLDVSASVATAIGHPVPSRVAAAGPRWRRAER